MHLALRHSFEPLLLVVSLLVSVTSACQPVADDQAEKMNEQPDIKQPSLLTIREGIGGTKLVRDTTDRSGKAATPPADIYEVVHYPSPAGELVAYLTPDPGDGKKHPAVIWAHGGFGGIGEPHWRRDDLTRPYRDQGLIVMVPSWRGENDNPGRFEMFFGEVEDAVAAVEYVRRLSYVDPNRVYMAGHSTGGTMTLLTTQATDKLRAAFSLGGAPDIEYLLAVGQAYGNTPFAEDDDLEKRMRSASWFVHFIDTPTFYFEGEASYLYTWPAEAMEEKAQATEVPFRSYIIEGADHFDIRKPINELIAAQIAADTGETPSVGFNQKVVQEAFDTHHGRERSWNVQDGHFFEQACTNGDARWCNFGGWHFYTGAFGPRDGERGLAMFTRGCKLEGVGCAVPGLELRERAETDDELARARHWLTKGCEEKSRWQTVSCARVAPMMFRGIGGPVDFEGLIEPLERACHEGKSGGSCHELGISYAAGRGVAVDQSKAVSLYRQACEFDNVAACADLAWRYSHGWGVREQPDKAFALAKTSCDAPSSYGCRILGQFYADGVGTDANPEMAYAYFARSCKMSPGYACERAGDVLGEHPDLGDDNPEALYRLAADSYRRGCEQNWGRGCFRLASLFETGKGVAKDAKKAEELHKRACHYDPRWCPEEKKPKTPQIGNFCDKGHIREVVNAHAEAIKACFEIGLADDPNLSGKVIYQWKVMLDGSTKAVIAAKSNLGAPEVLDCQRKVIEKFEFEEPNGGICIISYPFVFNASPEE